MVPALALSGVYILAALGRSSSEDLLVHYLQLLDNEFVETATNFESTALFTEEPLPETTQLLLERVLQIDSSNQRAVYHTAAQLGRRNRLASARKRMRTIAGENDEGYPPAHAWLAADQVSRGQVRTASEREVLLNDLRVAAKWDRVSPLLIGVLADLLVRSNEPGEAITVLRDNADREPRFWLRLAELGKQFNRDDIYDQAKNRIEDTIGRRIQNDAPLANDYADFARFALVSGDTDKAIEYARRGLGNTDDKTVLRRVLSEGYRIKYRESSNSVSRDFNLELLDAAMKADSTNPLVAEEVARLIVMGEQAPPELEEMLKAKLADGQANAVTHVLLANQKIQQEDWTAAQAHLEIALRIAPNSPVIMNNMAIVLSRKADAGAEDFAKAEALATRAIQIAGPNAEMYDTLGEARLANNKTAEAIQCFEAAIKLDDKRVITRRKLVNAYRTIGLDEMADLQERLILERQGDSQSNGQDDVDLN